MPPRRFSRYQGRAAHWIEDPKRGRIQYMDEPVPITYQDLADNRVHVAGGGDTWHSLAARYFPSFPRPAGLFWVIMEFQPVPAVDPTVAPASGTVLYIPSEAYLHAYRFGDRQARVAGL